MSTTWIVVGFTPDDFGRAALDHALFEARLRGRGVMVVNVTRGDKLVDDKYAAPEVLARLEEELAGTGLPHEIRQSMGSDVADEVLRVAKDVDARLIVLGLRRRSPVGKLIMGSVAQRVLLDATCPVLAVKPGDAPG